jgi:hypothetical protein
MGGFWHKAGLRSSTVVVAVAMVVPVASLAAATTDSKAVPANLVGRWSRNVKDATFPFPGVWSMVIKKNGTVAFIQPGASSVDFTTTFDVTANGRLNVGTVPICPTKAVYRWKTSGKLLTITKVSDTQCPTRVKLYAGVWKRK